MSSAAIHARSCAVSAPISGGALSSAVMCPAVSITTMAIPRERTWRARSSSASVAASGRGSFRPANTRPSSVLVWRASSRRWRATTHAYQTVIPPSSSASPATTGGPARRSAALRAIGGGCHEALHSEVRDERRRNRHGAVGLLPCFEERRDGARQRHARRETGQRSEEHTSELQSLAYLVCRLLLEKKKKKKEQYTLTEWRPKHTSVVTLSEIRA